MKKHERLIALLNELRQHRRPVTAELIAENFGVSVRTIYRDITDLVALGAPIDGEAGLGYLLRPGYFMPPLMFDPEELEALVLGIRWVQARPDAGLQKSARSALGKIATAAPQDLRDKIDNTTLWPILWRREYEPVQMLEVFREAMRRERAMHIKYCDEEGRPTDRIIWPIAIAFYEEKQIVAGWCTLRKAFRHFRVDRMQEAAMTEDRFGKRLHQLVREWEQDGNLA